MVTSTAASAADSTWRPTDATKTGTGSGKRPAKEKEEVMVMTMMTSAVSTGFSAS